LAKESRLSPANPVRQNLSACEEIVFELSVQGGLGELTENRKPVYSTPLVAHPDRKTFRREGIALRSTITLHKTGKTTKS